MNLTFAPRAKFGLGLGDSIRLSPLESGGEGEIRTHGTLAGSTVFETVHRHFEAIHSSSFTPNKSIVYGGFDSVPYRRNSAKFIPRICTGICTEGLADSSNAKEQPRRLR